MRLIAFLFATVFVASVDPTSAYAQSGSNHRSEEQIEPYHKHRDMRHGHDHVYPDRGAVVRDIPRLAVIVNYAGVSYRFDNGVWYEPRGPAYVVVDPPIGLIVPALPGYATPVMQEGETYLYANSVYYRARPELGGYEVVNDPVGGSAMDKQAQLERIAAADADETGGSPIRSAEGKKSSTVLLAAGPVAADAPAAATAPAVGVASAASPVPAAALTPATTPAPAVALASAPATLPTSSALAVPASATVPADHPAPGNAMVPVSTAAPPGAMAPVATPVPVAASSPPALSAPQSGPKVFIYPKTGQNSDQQAHDRYECYRFAVAQTGFDPMHVGSGAPRADQQSDYERAQAACLEGRGYSVR